MVGWCRGYLLPPLVRVIRDSQGVAVVNEYVHLGLLIACPLNLPPAPGSPMANQCGFSGADDVGVSG